MIRNHTIRLVIRLVFIFTNMTAIAWIMPDDRLFFSKIILCTLLLIQLVEFFYFLSFTNRQLTNMVAALKHRDFTIRFPRSGLGPSMDQLFQNMDQTISQIGQDAVETERRLQYLNMAFEEIETGIISLENYDRVILINKMARELLGINDLQDWHMAERLQPDFYRATTQLKDGGSAVVRIDQKDGIHELSLTVTRMKMSGQEYHLISFKDIHTDLDKKEIQSWQKLIRILTHEIMNSVTPISSMAETMEHVLHRGEREIGAAEVKEDLTSAVSTIKRRSEGLLDFVENYRKLTRFPNPKPSPESVENLINNVLKLLEAQILATEAKIEVNLDQSCDKVNIDRALIEQVIINLLRNSLDAVTGRKNPTITIHSYVERKFVCLSIEDNGTGISDEEIREVFVPFFTTKKEGSGIGLSLSKQVMLLHNGKISLQSEKQKGTIVTLRFPWKSENA